MMLLLFGQPQRGIFLSFSLFPFLRLSFEDKNGDLASVLLILVISSVVGVVLPNFLHKEPRTHNAIKLVNDCLGRVQLAFVSFYLTLLVVVEFKSEAQRRLMGSFLLTSFLFYFIGVRLTRNQNKKIEKLHGLSCSIPEGEEDCSISLDRRAKSQLLFWNTILCVISTVFALSLVLSPMVVNKASGHPELDQVLRAPQGQLTEQKAKDSH